MSPTIKDRNTYCRREAGCNPCCSLAIYIPDLFPTRQHLTSQEVARSSFTHLCPFSPFLNLIRGMVEERFHLRDSVLHEIARFKNVTFGEESDPTQSREIRLEPVS